MLPLDSRYWGYFNQMATESFAPAYAYATVDPSLSRVDGAFAGAMQQYLREDLGVKSEETYEILSIPTAAAPRGHDGWEVSPACCCLSCNRPSRPASRSPRSGRRTGSPTNPPDPGPEARGRGSPERSWRGTGRAAPARPAA
jgi:hypothetical protein